MNFSKRFIFSLVSLLFLTFCWQISAQTPNVNFNRTANFDVQNYIIRVSFDFKKKKVFGDTTVQIKPTQENFNQFELDAVDLNFESVQLEPHNENLKFTAKNGKIQIALDKNYSVSDLISVRFKYSTAPDRGVYFIQPRFSDGAEVRPAQIYSHNEAEDARYWLPSFDFPGDKAASEEFITVQKDQVAVGNGELLEKIENSDGTVTFHYRMTVPHSTYLISFVVGKYSKTSDVYKNIPLSYYVYPSEPDFARKAFGKTPQMMRVFEDLTGIPFPYNKYDQTLVSNFKFGGMENISATTISDQDIAWVNFKIGKEIAENLVSHELSHSWFGDLVTCKNWANLWLNEGFATYMEAAYREKIYGRDAYQKAIQLNADEFFADEAINNHRHGLFNTLADPNSEDLFDKTTYNKGAVVVYMLRETVGEANFWKAVNVYLNRYKYNNVEYKDLQGVMEEVSGQNLEQFFKQWVVGAGSPKLNVRQTYQTSTQTLKITVEQTQTNDGITPREFVLPLDLEIKTVKGAVNEKLNVSQRTETFSFNVKAKPTNISIDKDYKIPLKKINLQSLKTVN